MVTLKQIEALVAIVRLGSFERAARKLNTTQSTISKRIRELESAVGFAIFDRSRREARLTERGEHLLVLGEQMLSARDNAVDLKDAPQVPQRRIRLGVTELCALTWLPRLVAALRDAYPTVTLEAEVDMSKNLHERLVEDSIDVIVIPEAFSAPEITSVRIAQVQNVWMASPTLVPKRARLSVEELARHTILTQGSRSGSNLLVAKWLKSNGIALPRALSCDSLVALLGLTVAGLGVSYLPRKCFKPLLDSGKLAIVSTKPALPPVPYAVMYRNDRPTGFTSAVAQLALRSSDFSRQFVN